MSLSSWTEQLFCACVCVFFLGDDTPGDPLAVVCVTPCRNKMIIIASVAVSTRSSCKLQDNDLQVHKSGWKCTDVYLGSHDETITQQNLCKTFAYGSIFCVSLLRLLDCVSVHLHFNIAQKCFFLNWCCKLTTSSCWKHNKAKQQSSATHESCNSARPHDALHQL